MEITVIKIDKKDFTKKILNNGEIHPVCKKEILKAYSIAYIELIDGEIPHIQGRNFNFYKDTNTIEITYEYDDFIENDNFSEDSVNLYVYYYGIKDYALLFPEICKHDLKFATMLGNYYYEAEKAFKDECWISFSLLCGAIYEGILSFKYRNKQVEIKNQYKIRQDWNIDFSNYIKYAKLKNDINENQATIMDKTRKYRNNIHPLKMEKNFDVNKYITDLRTSAMNIMETLDYMLKNFKY